MTHAFTCGKCGAEFSLPQAALDKYPGWTPRACLACRDAKAGDSGRKRAPRRRTATATRYLTPDEVLERYHEGPETGLFTDGSANPNPGPGGWGLVWVEDGVIRQERHGRAAQSTNNRMELTAIIEGYRLVPRGTAVTVYTDSQLCVKTINEWVDRWERAGWKRKGGEIKNLDLVKELHSLARARPDIQLEWVRAHAGWRWNEYADALASTRSRP